MKALLARFLLTLGLLLSGGYGLLSAYASGTCNQQSSARIPEKSIAIREAAAQNDVVFIKAFPPAEKEKQLFFKVYATETVEEEDSGNEEISLKKKAGRESYSKFGVYTPSADRLLYTPGGCLSTYRNSSRISSSDRYPMLRVFRL